MAWLELSLALVLFFASHRLPVALGIKAAFANRGALPAYYTLYSALSLALLWWLILAAGRAPAIPLWDHAFWHRWAVNLAMPAACLLAAYGIAAPNPFAFEGKRAGFTPEAPGIAGFTRQPLLWALTLWSGAHLLANGDLAHALVFGPFLAFALLGMLALDSRNRRALPPEAAAHTSLLPAAALLSGRWHPRHLPSLPRLATGLAAWAALLHLHAPLIGASPLP
jgi:uncharacterized membrane protein